MSSSWNKGMFSGTDYAREYHLGTSAPKRAFSSSEPVEAQGSIEKPRDLNSADENESVSYDDHD
jgi:hypothetical protein